MPDPLVDLQAGSCGARPGGQAQLGVTVANPGDLVEGYRLEVVGEGVARWAEVVPPEVSVYPGEEATAVVVLSPPAEGALSGSWPFGVRARSLVDPDRSAVAEAVLEVGEVVGLQAKLVPVTSTGRWRGRHVLHLRNWGNAPVTLRLVPADPDAALGFLVRPSVVQLAVGSEVTARLWVRGKRPFLRGTGVRVPFSVAVEREGATAPTGPTGPAAAVSTAERPVVDGALHQQPVLTRAVTTLGALALVLVLAGVVWAVLRPPRVGAADYVDDVPPDRPARVSAVATGPTTVNVTWSPVDRVRSWEVQASTEDPEAVFDVHPAERAQTSTTVAGLPAGTTTCFRVRALGFGVQGPVSERACATTPAAAATAAPTAVESLPPVAGQSEPPSAPGQPGPLPVDPGPVASPSASPTGPASPTSSASPTGSGSPTASPTGDGSTTPSPTGSATPGTPAPGSLTGKWVASTLAAAVMTPDVPLVQDELARLRRLGQTPQLINSGDPQYADLQPVTERPAPGSWLVVLGPYDTPELAAQVCGQVGPSAAGDRCRVFQPDPS